MIYVINLINIPITIVINAIPLPISVNSTNPTIIHTIIKNIQSNTILLSTSGPMVVSIIFINNLLYCYSGNIQKTLETINTKKGKYVFK
jgi:hypothetical protein